MIKTNNKNRALTFLMTFFISMIVILNVSQISAAALDHTTYNGEPYIILNENEPEFTDKEKKSKKSYEKYGEFDHLGRCTTAKACIGFDLMPTQKRESIGNVKPTGWQSVKYDFVDGKYLYNRCHLIGYQLTAENANKQNLITGTRYLNVEGMLPFENMVADYIKETNNHVLYQVDPIFNGDNLVAEGVKMQANTKEDNGEGISFNVFCFNVQPGVTIDYMTGESTQGDNAEIPSTSKYNGNNEKETISLTRIEWTSIVVIVIIGIIIVIIREKKCRK